MQLELENIRGMLKECEISIIHHIVERSKYYIGPCQYAENGVFLKLLEKTELIESIFGRYECPEEYPFTTKININKSYHYKYNLSGYFPKSTRILNINYNNIILQNYSKILKDINNNDINDDIMSNCGINPIALINDVNILQAISKRCHLGKVVAENKYRSNSENYINSSEQEIYNTLTDLNVENKVIERVKHKAEKYILECCEDTTSLEKIPDIIVNIFKNIIIPITKTIQVEYIKARREI